MNIQIKFPQFRKYKNGQSFFRIDSAESFTELKKSPNGIQTHHFVASILPDRNLVYDMLFNYEPYWDVISKEEFDEMLQKAKK